MTDDQLIKLYNACQKRSRFFYRDKNNQFDLAGKVFMYMLKLDREGKLIHDTMLGMVLTVCSFVNRDAIKKQARHPIFSFEEDLDERLDELNFETRWEMDEFLPEKTRQFMVESNDYSSFDILIFDLTLIKTPKAEIANQLGVSKTTTTKYIKEMYIKLKRDSNKILNINYGKHTMAV